MGRTGCSPNSVSCRTNIKPEQTQWPTQIKELRKTLPLSASTSARMDEVLRIPPHQVDQFKTRRLGRVMRGLGWEGPVTLTLQNGQKAKGYWRLTGRPDEPHEGGI